MHMMRSAHEWSGRVSCVQCSAQRATAVHVHTARGHCACGAHNRGVDDGAVHGGRFSRCVCASQKDRSSECRGRGVGHMQVWSGVGE